ncbi:hypothetical protein CYLTODRAFT_424195 [Cylindrobasidium torrendii FP15055 ss-10]|uniref:Uncharacterized protein n=1 Tax=Cylindrobasidium torrendii FP15055 ss-10 TaxID=1314674 RepID=A0A0D7B535_9AGAR|nr:hypothetical protein CYLTODRAFT_424195 [Cylindrobasidium torrendii FP15055 ss-10]
MLEKVAFPDGLPESLLSDVVLEVERPQCPKHPNNPRCSCPSSSRSTPSRIPSSSRAGPSGAADDERLLARMAELRPVRPKVISTASTIAGPSRLDARAHYSGPGSALMPQYDGGPALGRSISADARPFGATMDLSTYWPQQNAFCQCGSENCVCGGMAHNQASLDPLGEWLRRNGPPCSCSQELGGCQCASQPPPAAQEEQYPGFSPLFRTTSSPPNMYGAGASYEYGFGELGSESSFGDVEMSFGDVHESSEDLFRTFRTYHRE